jgi:uncharacterized membrane protein YbhN (UPF0104 family)
MSQMADKPGRAPRSSLNRWWLRGLVSAGVLGWLAWKVDWAPLGDCLRQAEPIYWLAAIATYALFQLPLSSTRWRWLATPLGFTAPWTRYLKLYYVGLFFNLFLPTSMGGDVVRAWSLADEPRRRVAAMLSVVSDRISGLIALVLLASIAAAVDRGSLPANLRLLVGGLTVAMFTGLALLPYLARFSNKLRTLAMGLSLTRGHIGRWLGALGISFAVQALSTLQVALAGMALGLKIPLLGYAAVVPLVSLLTMLPISISGLGVREIALKLMLAPFGVPEAAAVALGLAWFGQTLVMGLLGGLVYLFIGTGAAPAAGDSSFFPETSTDTEPGTLRGTGVGTEGIEHGPVHCGAHQGRTRQPAAAA